MLNMQNLRKVFRTALVETHALRDLTLDPGGDQVRVGRAGARGPRHHRRGAEKN